MTQLNLFPRPTYAELCYEEAKVYFHCVVCFKKKKRGTGIKDKFCSEKHEEIYRKWEKEIEEFKKRIRDCANRANTAKEYNNEEDQLLMF